MAEPEMCECCGKYNCSFVKDRPGNRELQAEINQQELDYLKGRRKEKPDDINKLASQRNYDRNVGWL